MKQEINTKIKIGDSVNWRGSFGRHAQQLAIIKHIEHCPDGGKYGQSVEEIDASLKNECTFDLTNGHWAYGEQIELIDQGQLSKEDLGIK